MTALQEVWNARTTPTIDTDTIICRAVGEKGTAQIKLCGAERGWLRDPINRRKGKRAAREAYQAAFGDQPTRIGVAAVPYSDTEDGDEVAS